MGKTTLIRHLQNELKGDSSGRKVGHESWKEEALRLLKEQEFISRYELGSSATVLRSLQTLLKKELIFSDLAPDGKPWYGVYDILFKRWIQG